MAVPAHSDRPGLRRGPILVTGATGNVGRQVVAQLRQMGAAVRALTRDPGSARLPEGVDVARADLADPRTLAAPLEGVAAVFLVWPFLTAEAAPAALGAVPGDARIVYLSTMGIRDDRRRQADPITDFHAEVERLIRRSGHQWTFLRAGGFATNTLGWAPRIRAEGVVREPFAAAARPLIHERDIAAVAVRALADPGHAGATHLLTGPEALTAPEQVRLIGEAIGRPLRFEEIPPEEARRGLLETWGDPAVVDGMLGAWAAMEVDPEPVSPAVERIAGAPARSFRQWALDHADDFR